LKLNLLCLDDRLSSLNEIFRKLFNPLLIQDTALPVLSGGQADSFRVSGFGEDSIEVCITSNREGSATKVLRECQDTLTEKVFDIVLVDDNWGASGTSAGQEILLPELLKIIASPFIDLPVFVLFTQHWDDTERVSMFCDLMAQFPDQQRRMTGLSKNDTSSLMLLIQRVITEKRIVEANQRLVKENARLRSELAHKYCPSNMIGTSASMAELYRIIKQVSCSPCSILLRGESGTGKELVAAAIHNNSDRSGKDLIKVNCSAIPEALIESELFGYEKGAFTGATSPKPGKFELAEGGTIFLDEIGDLPLLMQVKLLRVLQSKEIERLGGIKTIKLNIRVIAATNRDLETEMQANRFREDLYYRLNVFPIYLPPLRKRKTDIAPLLEHFLKKFTAEYNKEIDSITDAAINKLMSYQWPGNVRELENCIGRAVLLCVDSVLSEKDFHFLYEGKEFLTNKTGQDWCPKGLDMGRAGKAWELLEACEDFASAEGTVTQAGLAKQWGCSRSAVTQRITNVKDEIRALLDFHPNASLWLNARPFINKWQGW
jgi:transcriptional regulator with PAS, ATPase and Fis domain